MHPAKPLRPPPATTSAPSSATTTSGRVCRILLASTTFAATAATRDALAAEPAEEINFADLSLEQLMNETVTSVSKKEQRLDDAPAAISVLSNEDIRRSGATRLTDAFRLVPGLDVGAINSSQTAVSARGFNGLYANKLLVLVDGRAVYSPIYGGVVWDLQQFQLDDIDRVEVIRGPGATIWGANAVNGVINVVTRDARDTQGGLLYAGGGDVSEAMVGARHGGRLGERTYFRVYGGAYAQDDYPAADGSSAGDGWSTRQGGFRVDHHATDDSRLTWQSEYTEAEINDGDADAYNASTLARWTRDPDASRGSELQFYYDRNHRDDPLRARVTTDIFDLSFQHRFPVGERQDIVWGAGYRHNLIHLDQTSPAVLVLDDRLSLDLFNCFVQDEITLVPDKLSVTLGAKLEHNDYTGFEFQPSARLVYKPAARHTLWAAISRAVRTPSVVEGRRGLAPVVGAPIPAPGGPYLPIVTGDPSVNAETLWAYELGWRVQPTSRVRADLALFFNDYDDLIDTGTSATLDPATGLAETGFNNNLAGETYGGEVSVTVSPVDSWRLTAAYSLLLTDIRPSGSSAALIEDSTPVNQASLRSAHDLTRRIGFDAQLRYVDSLPTIPAYLALDLRLAYRPNENLEFSLTAQNLLDQQHAEQAAPVGPFVPLGEVPRGFHGKITWRF